jgi:hypothetical protein
MKRIFTVLLVLFFPCLLFSAGGVGPDFLRMNPHAKTSAMSDAFCGLAGDINGIFFNPAGISHVKQPVVSLTHFTSFSDTNYEYLGGVYPVDSASTVGAALMVDYTMSFHEYNEFGVDCGNVDNTDFLLALAYSYAASPYLFIGGNLKGFYSKLYKYSKQGAAIDIGALLKFGENPDTYGGIAIQNIGFQSAYIDVADAMPLNFKAGLGIHFDIIDKTSACVAVDVNRLLTKDEMPTLDFGAEALVQNILALRAGYGIRHDVMKASFGVGIILDRVHFSYSFQPFDALGSNHRVSLDVIFK